MFDKIPISTLKLPEGLTLPYLIFYIAHVGFAMVDLGITAACH